MLNFERDVHGERWGPSLSHPCQPDQLRPLGAGNVQIKACGNDPHTCGSDFKKSDLKQY